MRGMRLHLKLGTEVLVNPLRFGSAVKLADAKWALVQTSEEALEVTETLDEIDLEFQRAMNDYDYE